MTSNNLNMKLLYIILLILLASNKLNAQSIYYDALLCGKTQEGDFSKVVEDPDKYGITEGDKKTLESFRDFLKKPFDKGNKVPDFIRVRAILRKVNANTIEGSSAFAAGGLAGILLPLTGLSNLSTAQVDTILYGATVYFADEFKRGYTETYLRAFDRSISQVGEMQVLFPKTYQKLRSFDLARYKEIGKELKLVFNDDLSGTLTNLITHVENPDNGAIGAKFWFLKPELCRQMRQQPSFGYLKVSSQVGQKLINGVHPSDILHYLDDTYYSSPVVIQPNYPETRPANLSLTLTGASSLTLSQPVSAIFAGPISGTVNAGKAPVVLTGLPSSATISVIGSATLTSGSNTTVISTTVSHPLTVSTPPASLTIGDSFSFTVNTATSFSMATTEAVSLTTTGNGSVTTISTGGISISTSSSAVIELTGAKQSLDLKSGTAKLTQGSTIYTLSKPGSIPISGTLLSGTLTSGTQVEIPVSKPTNQTVSPQQPGIPSLALSGSAIITLSESATGTVTGPLAITASSASLTFATNTTVTATGAVTLTRGTDTTMTGYNAPTSLTVKSGGNIKLLAGTVAIASSGSLSVVTVGAAKLTSNTSVSLTTAGIARVAPRTTAPLTLTLAGKGSANLLSGTATLAHNYTTGTAMSFTATSPATIPTAGLSLSGTLGGELEFVPTGAERSDPMRTFGDAVHLYNILQQSLRDTSAVDNEGKASVWISFEKLSKLKSVAEKTYFLALLYREDPSFFDQKGVEYLSTSFSEIASPSLSIGNVDCSKCLAAFNTIKSKNIASLLSILTKMDEYVRVKKVSLTDEQNFLPFMQMTGEVVQLGFTLADNNPAFNQRIRRYADLAGEVYQMYNAVRVKNYANIPAHVGNVLRAIEQDTDGHFQSELSGRIIAAFQKKLTDPDITGLVSGTVVSANRLYRLLKKEIQEDDRWAISQTKQMLISAFEKNWNKPGIQSAIISTLSSTISYAPVLSRVIHRIDYWSGFTSGIVSATSSAEVNEVIKKFASPPSSFIDKRNTPFSITVSGMPGVFVGLEKLDPNSNLSNTPVASTSADGGFRTTIGLALPIGFDFTWQVLRKDPDKPSWSLGLFAQLIDLGAMLNYRLGTNANSLPDAVTFRSVISPGLSLNLGFPNSAFTVGAGYQYTAALRHITKDQQEKNNDNLLNAHRWQIRAAYDIPIFRILGIKN
jgi:hypothetical protein